MNPLDTALQAHTPVVAVPRYEKLATLDDIGHRFLVAQDGLWLEVRRRWCHIVWPVHEQAAEVRMPFGTLEKTLELSFGRFPTEFLSQLTLDAIAAHPVEIAAVGIWNAHSGQIRYAPCEAISQGVGHIKARWPDLGEHEEVVIDGHSHGPIRPYFSRTDRADIGSNVVLACVVGKTDTMPEVVVSLFAAGKEITVRVPAGFGPQSDEEMELAGQDSFNPELQTYGDDVLA